MSQGVALAIDTSAWTIVDGKLYLNKRHVRAEWRENQQDFIRAADRVWAQISAGR